MRTATAVALAFRAEVALQQIAIIKNVPANIRRAEDRLWNDLRETLGIASSNVITNLIDAQYVPGSPEQQAYITRHLQDALGPFADILQLHAATTANDARQDVFDQLANLFALSEDPEDGGVEIGFGEFPEHVRDLLQERTFVASQATIDRITGNVIANLTESYEEGLGIHEAARRLEEVFDDMERYELRRVARTELLAATNEGAYQTGRELGIEYHEWIAAEDERTRESHLEMSGVIVRVGDRFPNGLHYPGDRDGGIEEWINCRCRTAPFLMPEGMQPPPGAEWFRETDLIAVTPTRPDPEPDEEAA